MGKGSKSGMRRGFGRDEHGQPLLPAKFGNVKLSNIEHRRERGGCSLCYPHGPETTNATSRKNTRSWKQHRPTRFKPRD